MSGLIGVRVLLNDARARGIILPFFMVNDIDEIIVVLLGIIKIRLCVYCPESGRAP